MAFANWPPLDPLTHPTEAPILQELRYRLSRGEQGLEFPSGPQDDDDVVAVDEAKLSATPAFTAGLFASYAVYPHWPDFMLHEPGLLEARDSTGPNPVFGYIGQLVKRLPHPLVVTEYGVSSSNGISHLHPLGWHQGGLNEAEQAALLGRLARTMQEAGTAGGMVVSLHDEWYKQNWLVRAFEQPAERGTLWLNDLNPEERLGLMGFRPSKWKLFTRRRRGLAEGGHAVRQHRADRRAGDPVEGARRLRSLQAASDEALLVLRLTVDCLDCAPREPKAPGQPRFDKASYAIALNTSPGAFGVRQLPFGSLAMPAGATFLLWLTDPPAARILVANNYNPYELAPTPGVPSDTEVRLRFSMNPALAQGGGFGEMIVEPNRRRFTRDGRLLPPQRISRSTLRYGIDNASGPDVDSIGEWYADAEAGAILVRIPWGKLLVVDPSRQAIFAGFDENRAVRSMLTSGIEIAAFALAPPADPSRKDLAAWTVASSLPATRNGALSDLARVTWSGWNTVKSAAYTKAAYRDAAGGVLGADLGAGRDRSPGRGGRIAVAVQVVGVRSSVVGVRPANRSHADSAVPKADHRQRVRRQPGLPVWRRRLSLLRGAAECCEERRERGVGGLEHVLRLDLLPRGPGEDGRRRASVSPDSAGSDAPTRRGALPRPRPSAPARSRPVCRPRSGSRRRRCRPEHPPARRIGDKQRPPGDPQFDHPARGIGVPLRVAGGLGVRSIRRAVEQRLRLKSCAGNRVPSRPNRRLLASITMSTNGAASTRPSDRCRFRSIRD